ncbi:MAG TPA: DUF389 domain-containing protein, partial [Flavobacteriaceae bacterium]|nr:DUF389 domain-containing protein [Flavobacteriaceae bacterium]
VVIGAMLISPLMGPILGVGLSIGINDIDTLKKSMANLGIMLAISLLVSFLFFSIPLFQKATPELLARTEPDVRDVLIAMFGGLALIVAITRPTPQTNTVAGVAIATALMPPLCTAGYGLAVNNIDYFLGAIFLFTINTVFIALATFVIVKYLHFPMVKYINSAKRKTISRFASFVAIIVLAASVYTFYDLYEKNKFTDNIENYKIALKDKGYVLIDDDEKAINYTEKTLVLTIFGKVNPDDRKKINDLKVDFNLKEVNLIIHGAIDDSKVINEIQSLREKFTESQKIIEGRDDYIKSKDERIHYLEKELRQVFKSRIPFAKISEEAKINYEELEELSYSKMVKTNFKSMDTINVFTLKWYDSIPKKQIESQQKKIHKWLKARLDLDTLQIVVK